MSEIIVALIPITAIVMGIGIGMLAIFLNFLKRREMYALYHRERMAAIEKGIDVPPLPDEFFAEDGKPLRPESPHKKLQTGLILFFVGLAATPCMYLMNMEIWYWGSMLSALGAAFLIYYFAVGRKEALAQEEAAKRRAEEMAGNGLKKSMPI